MMAIRTCIRVVLAAFVAGCAAQGPAGPSLPDVPGTLVRTERDVYRATVVPSAVSFSVVATFTNVTRDTLWLHPCVQQRPYPPVVTLERQEAGAWRAVWGPVCTSALMLDPPRLLPGESRTDTVRVWGARTAHTLPDFPAGPVAGAYRLVYGAVYRRWHPLGPGTGTEDALGERVPAGLLASNTFQLQE
jgi:hypothetical protein